MKYEIKELLTAVNNNHFASVEELADFFNAKNDIDFLIKEGYIKKDSAYVELTSKGIDYLMDQKD